MDIKIIENRVRMRKLRLFKDLMKVRCYIEKVNESQVNGQTFDPHDMSIMNRQKHVADSSLNMSHDMRRKFHDVSKPRL